MHACSGAGNPSGQHNPSPLLGGQTENKRELRPAVERILAAFGDPLATVRNLGSGVATAVAAMHRHGIPNLLCHFLAAVSKRLLDEDHAKLRCQSSCSRWHRHLRDLLATTRGPA